jgi:hypothetical protein
MKSQSYPLRVPNGLLQLAEVKAKYERTDRATALRQWLYIGAEEYVLDLVSRGQITIGRAAEMLDMTVAAVQQLALERGVPIGATGEQAKAAIDYARQLAAER